MAVARPAPDIVVNFLLSALDSSLGNGSETAIAQRLHGATLVAARSMVNAGEVVTDWPAHLIQPQWLATSIAPTMLNRRSLAIRPIARGIYHAA